MSDVFTTNSTDASVDAAVAEEMPAEWVNLARCARHGRAPFTSSPIQPACEHQLIPRVLSRTLFDVSLLEKRDMYASNSYRKYTVPVSEYSSRNCFGQNAVPRARMARTKMMARKDRDDRHRDDERRGDDRRSEERRGREPTKPPARRRRRGTPPPEKYICIFCQKENQQRINHKRHLIMQHHCRMDGTPATAEDIAQARVWSSRTTVDRGGQFKSKEFVESTASEDDDDTTPGLSTPARRKSPSPPRRKHARQEKSISPRRSTLSSPNVEVSRPEVLTVSKVSTDVDQRHVRTISSLHLASAAMDFHLSTMQVAEQLAIQYVLDEEQRLGVIRELQKLRLGAKSLALKIRSEFPLNVKS